MNRKLRVATLSLKNHSLLERNKGERLEGHKNIRQEVTEMKKEYIKPFAWGMGIGAIVLLIVIFSAGWVVTSGSADAKADKMVQDAVIDRLVPICVQQFLEDPKKEERLKELREVDYWKRGEYVEKQGWATMPGEKDPDREVAEACARWVLELE
jgi:hypothetical protein